MRRCGSVDETHELVATEQLLNTLPQDIQIWVQERKPTTSSEAGRLADDYIKAYRPMGALTTSNSGLGRVEKISAADRKCHNCGEIGHIQ